MRFSAHLDTSHHEQPHPCKDAVVFADSLIGVHNAMKCVLVVIKAVFTMVLGVPTGKIPGD
jgi:hypothetical protein